MDPATLSRKADEGRPIGHSRRPDAARDVGDERGARLWPCTAERTQVRGGTRVQTGAEAEGRGVEVSGADGAARAVRAGETVRLQREPDGPEREGSPSTEAVPGEPPAAGRDDEPPPTGRGSGVRRPTEPGKTAPTTTPPAGATTPPPAATPRPCARPRRPASTTSSPGRRRAICSGSPTWHGSAGPPPARARPTSRPGAVSAEPPPRRPRRSSSGGSPSTSAEPPAKQPGGSRRT